jgi:AcrR family transcriptional regulator
MKGTTDLSTRHWDRYAELSLTPILEAARDAIEELGYHGATVREIAQRADLSMPALYYHHGSKEGVLMALLDIAMDDVLAHVTGGLDAAGESARDRLINLTTAVAMHMTRRQRLAKLHSEHRFLSAEERRRYLTKRAELNTLLVDVLATGVDEDTFPEQDIRFTARVILGMLQAIADWYETDGPHPPTEIATRYVAAALLLAGDRRRPPAP